MSNKTRKHIWPASLAAMLGIAVMLAVMAAVVWSPGPAQAQDGGPTNPFGGAPAGGDGDGGPTNPFGDDGDNGDNGAAGDMITSDSTSASGSPELKLIIADLGMPMRVGSSIVLYLEDDFQEPESIPMTSVYLVAEEPTTTDTGSGSRVYVTQPVKIKTGAYFDEDKKDIAIRVSVPDMCTTDTSDCQGANGLMMGQKVTLVIESDSGIKNPSEAGTHSVFFDLLGPADPVPSAGNVRGRNDAMRDADPSTEKTVETVAKISLSDVDNSRGYEMTVTGSGFNNGTTAGVYVLYDTTVGSVPSGDAEKALCERIINMGTKVGDATVGDNDKAAVTFEVTAPTFGPGNHNYICMVDGEGLMSDTDVEDFKLEPSIKVVPSSVSSGDTVNVFAQDFPRRAGSFAELQIAKRMISDSFIRSSRSIGIDGSGEVTFEVPGGFIGILRIDAQWGTGDNKVSENSKITIEGADLQSSKTAVMPNESIIVNGTGFGSQTCIAESNITLDNVPVRVHNDSLSDSCGGNGVLTSNSGQFVATVILWPANDRSANPTLIAGTHELSVEDGREYSSSVNLTIAEPSITVTPDVAGPRDFITITGQNWPVDNLDNTIGDQVRITVADFGNGRNYSVYADSAGPVPAGTPRPPQGRHS